MATDASTTMVPAGQTLYLTLPIVRPNYGVVVINLQIFRIDHGINRTLLHNQT